MRKLSFTIAALLCCAATAVVRADLPRQPRPPVDEKLARQQTLTLADLDPAFEVDKSHWHEEFAHRDWYQDGKDKVAEHCEEWSCKARANAEPRSQFLSQVEIFQSPETARTAFDKEVDEIHKGLPEAKDWSPQVQVGQRCSAGWSPKAEVLYVVVQLGTRVFQMGTTHVSVAGPARVEQMVREWTKRKFAS